MSAHGPAPQVLRRRALLIVLPLITTAVVLTYVVELNRPATDPFNVLALPVLTLLFAALTAAHQLRLLSQRWVEHSVYLVTAAAYFGKLGFTLLAPYDSSALARELAQVYIWTPFIYGLAFLVGGDTTAVYRASAVYVLSLGVGLAGVLAGTDLSDQRLAEYYLSTAVQLSLLYLVGGLRARLGSLQGDLEAMARLAAEDYLTGVPNRRRLEAQLQRDLDQYRRYGTPMSIILLDIDNFKRFNDSYGHEQGDEVLKRVADTLQRELRTSDAFGRWGGEEFLVVASHTDAQHAALLAERLRQLVAETPLPEGRSVTASFGVAAFRADRSLGELLSRADTALYRAKSEGKNRVALDQPAGLPAGLRLPELSYPFAPALERAPVSVVTQVNDWLARFDLGPAPADLRERFASSFCALARSLHPYAAGPWPVLLGKWYCWAFLHDDRCDATELGRVPDRLRALTNRLLAVFAGAAPKQNDEPLALALADLRAELLAAGGPTWLTEVQHALEHHFGALHWEAVNRASGAVPDLGRYLEMRPVTAGLLLDDLFFAADGLSDLRDGQLRHRLEELSGLANEVVCWANDLLSLDKELRQGDVHNLVRVLQSTQELSLEVAIERAERRHAQTLARYLECEGQLRSLPNARPGLERYLKLLRARMRGIYDWSLLSGRYR